MARLLADENFPVPAVEALRLLGHDVVTLAEAGKANLALPDEAVLAWAAREGRAVLTLNRKHFLRLHWNQPDHSGIVVCTFDPSFDQQAQRIHEAVVALEALASQLIRVNRPNP